VGGEERGLLSKISLANVLNLLNVLLFENFLYYYINIIINLFFDVANIYIFLIKWHILTCLFHKQ
jgi:hypothetical protein